MNALLEERVRKLYPEWPHPVAGLRKLFCETALKELENILGKIRPLEEAEREEIAGFIYEAMESCARKIGAFEDIVIEAIKEVSEELARALTPVVIGSVARFEGELGAEIDVDFLIDPAFSIEVDARRQIRDLISVVNVRLEEIGQKFKGRFKIRTIEDISIYTLDEILTPAGIDHLTNLLIGCHAIKNKAEFLGCILTARKKAEKKDVLKELKSRIDGMLKKRGADPVKTAYDVTGYVVRMLALNYLTYDDICKNYWRLCEMLQGKLEEGLLCRIAVQVRSILYARRRRDRGEEVRYWLTARLLRNSKEMYLEMKKIKKGELT